MSDDDNRIQREFEAVIEQAYVLSADVGKEVEAVLRAGLEEPLSKGEVVRLLSKVLDVVRRNAEVDGDRATLSKLEGGTEAVVNRVIEARARLTEDVAQPHGRKERLGLEPRSGISPGPVKPSPVFHGREVPMWSGFVRVFDIDLWDGNDRLEIHLNQFRKETAREPMGQEILDFMLSKLKLPGLMEEDEFEIVNLARSVATNGVRKPPILDLDGTLLDGNRRLAACHYILANDEFTTAQKMNAESIFVWQLTEHATDDDRNAVVVSLNFEPDCKQDWPEYVKARKVAEAWEAALVLEPHPPGTRRQADLKRELSQKFALGPVTTTVNRYLKMVSWADGFEDYHVNEKRRNEFQVKHQANRYFQYFDELAKGERQGVAHVLRHDDAFRKTVFDLLFQDKFRNWKQIRDLKHIHENEEAREELRKARDVDSVDAAEEHLENAVDIARTRRAEARTLGANTRIESFVKWLEELPVKAFRDQIKPENLRGLLRALRLVERQSAAVLGDEAS